MFRLRSKILLAFSIVILTGTALMVGFINMTTRSGYEKFIQQKDVDFAENISGLLRDYYLIGNSWIGVERVLDAPSPRGSQMKGMNNTRMNLMMTRLVLADHTGRILINTTSGPELDRDYFRGEHLGSGMKILVENKVVGYVFAGTMIHNRLSENEEFFINKTTIIIISVSLFTLLVSMIFSWFFAGRLARPVSALNSAVSSVQKGDYSERVPVRGSDELARLSESFNSMALSLENNDRWRKQIIADSAHELRTPVSLIQGNLEMILDGVYEADREHIQNIYDETLVLSRLIKELQELSSAESGSMSLTMEELDLNNLIENVMSIFRAGVFKEKISLNSSVDGDLPSIPGDYQKLKQVFANVLANAFRHTPEGGSIDISGEISHGNVLIEIRDTGCGIDREDLEKVFERFYRTDSSRNRSHGGSGLGLAISREIVKLHGGEIYARSVNNEGTSIFISLPMT